MTNEELEHKKAVVKQAWPKEIAVTLCRGCGRVFRLAFADHVNREDEVPPRACSKCGTELAVSVYRHERELMPKKSG
jgi:hypothetical protein